MLFRAIHTGERSSGGLVGSGHLRLPPRQPDGHVRAVVGAEALVVPAAVQCILLAGVGQVEMLVDVAVPET
jgi:hypothetical protein